MAGTLGAILFAITAARIFGGGTSFANCLAAALFRVPFPRPHVRRLDLDAVEEGWKELVQSNPLACNGQPARDGIQISNVVENKVMTAEQKPYLNTREDAAIRFLGLPTLMRSTGESNNESFGLMEHWEMPPGFASPYHMHHLEDEAFYVLEGEMAFVCDGKWMKGGPGTYIFGPREIPHGFKVVGSSPARMLLLCAPAGFERFVLELSVPFNDFTPPDMAKLMVVATKYKIDILGPLPE